MYIYVYIYIHVHICIWMALNEAACKQRDVSAHRNTQGWRVMKRHVNSMTHLHLPLTPRRTATRCNTLQHTATHRNTLQHAGMSLNEAARKQRDVFALTSHTTTHHNMLQHTATHCNTLQHTGMALNEAARQQRDILTLASAPRSHLFPQPKTMKNGALFAISVCGKKPNKGPNEMPIATECCLSSRPFISAPKTMKYRAVFAEKGQAKGQTIMNAVAPRSQSFPQSKMMQYKARFAERDMCIYIYHIFAYMCMYIYIYIYIHSQTCVYMNL